MKKGNIINKKRRNNEKQTEAINKVLPGTWYQVYIVLVLDIVSKVSMYRNIERVFPSTPWHPRLIYAGTERKLPCMYRLSNIEIIHVN